MTKKLTPTIGIEIHVELATKSKMFCGCPADHFAKEPNTQTCPVCLGYPGALPVANKQAVDWTIMIGLALGCQINNESKFDRKHYFYPDLPKGYQISQYDQPFAQKGKVLTRFGEVAITRVHLEEDTGKLQHQVLDGEKVSLVDFNRSSVPLVEIVSEPDIHSAEQAKDYAKTVAQIIKFLGVSDADMEKGSMRLEANVSWGLDLGYKVEVKNINSFNFLAKAIDFELSRQRELLDKGITPDQETRGFNETKGITFTQRSKEDAADYRYFPDPDLPPMHFTDKQISALQAQMPELPSQIRSQWQHTYQIKDQYYEVLLSNKDTVAYTQQAFELGATEKLDFNDIASAIVNKKYDITQLSPNQLVKSIKTSQSKVSDKGQLEEWVTQAISANPNAVADFKAGKQASLQFLLGQVMKLSRGQADPKLTLPLLQQKLTT